MTNYVIPRVARSCGGHVFSTQRFFLFKRKKFSVGNCNAEENSKFFLNKGNKEPKTVAEIKGSW
jgi:hypothetical protein